MCQSSISTWAVDLSSPIVQPTPYHSGCESLLPLCRLPSAAAASAPDGDLNGDQGNDTRIVWPVTASAVCRVAVSAQAALQNDAIAKVRRMHSFA